MNDIRFTFRQLWNNRGFAALAIITLGLGIGACTAMFTVVNGVLLRPLDYAESDKLVIVRETKMPEFPQFSVAPGSYFDWREQSSSFDQLAGIRGGFFNLTGMGEPVRLGGESVTPNYFDMLRVRPILGRGFAESDPQTNPRIVILSRGLWQRQFGSRTDVIEQTIQLDGQPFTIVGVMPDGFDRNQRADIYVLRSYSDDNQNYGGHNMRVIGRLKSDVTLAQATAELEGIALRIAEAHPETNRGWSVSLTPMLDDAVGEAQPVLWSLLGAVGFLLLIACANVANLMLARATARSKEISVRSALGANRGRIVRQLLTESVVLSVIGGVLGIVLAKWGLHMLLALAPENLPRVEEIAIDARAMAFTFILAVGTGILFGLAPIFLIWRVDVQEVLKESARGSSVGGKRQRMRSVLVVGEVAVALMLLVGAGLFVRSFDRLSDVDPGFDPAGAYIAGVTLPQSKYGTPAQQAQFVEGAVAALSAIPGVKSAAASVVVPFSGEDFNLAFTIPGQPDPAPGQMQSSLYYAISPDYFEAMGIRLVRGRAFTSSDATGASRVAIINESMARIYFPDQDPIGKHIHISDADSEIVGIVADVLHYDLSREPRVQAYEPFAQIPFNFVSFVVRANDPDSFDASLIRQAIYSVDPDQPIASIRALEDLLSTSIARQRFSMTLFTVFSVVATFLSAIGIYGVMAFSVTQRTGEIGIRMALGAQRTDVLKLLLKQGIILAGLGILLGIVGAIGVSRLLQSMLFGISATDPATFLTIPLVLLIVAGLACWIPARRASHVSPMEALRHE